MQKHFTKPAAIFVYVTVSPTKRNGISEAFTSRIGACNDEAGIAKIIAEDKAAMSDTFGGLIPSVPIEGRAYRAFRAEWTEIKF